MGVGMGQRLSLCSFVVCVVALGGAVRQAHHISLIAALAKLVSINQVVCCLHVSADVYVMLVELQCGCVEQICG